MDVGKMAGKWRSRSVGEKRWAGISISIACVIVIAAIGIILAAGAGYTVLIGDDFTHGVRVGVFHTSLPKYFAASLMYVQDLYMDWQGTWFAMFLQAFLSPVNNFGLPQLKAVMIGNAILFLLALVFMLWAGLSFFSTGDGKTADRGLIPLRLVILTLIFVAVTNADLYTEIYFWFSGAVAYSMPFSLLLIGLTLLLLTNREGVKTGTRRAYAACAGVLLFLSSGGSLAVAGAGCYMALVLTLVFYLYHRKASACNIAVFAAGLAGAVINAAAPGNFSRHDKTAGAGLHFGRALWYAARMFLEEGSRLFRKTVFGLIFLLLIAAGIYLSGKCRIALREYGIASVLALAAGPVAEFPVAVGYGSYNIPNRCYFIIDTLLVVSLLNFALFLGICLHRLAGISSEGPTLWIMCYVCLAALLVSPLSLEDMPLYRVARSVHNGSYREYYEECVRVYEYLESCPEEDVVLEMPEYIEDFECFYFDSDENGWVNVGMAEYYGKKSIRRAE